MNCAKCGHSSDDHGVSECSIPEHCHVRTFCRPFCGCEGFVAPEPDLDAIANSAPHWQAVIAGATASGGDVSRLVAEVTADYNRILAEVRRLRAERAPTGAAEYKEGDLDKFFGCAPNARHADDPEEGTWGWALQQLKQGNRVTNGETVGYYSFEHDGSGELLCLSSPKGEPCRVGLILTPEDFEATDWRVVESAQ